MGKPWLHYQLLENLKQSDLFMAIVLELIIFLLNKKQTIAVAKKNSKWYNRDFIEI